MKRSERQQQQTSEMTETRILRNEREKKVQEKKKGTKKKE